MKITFIRPHLFEDRSSDALEPLVFALLAGLTPPDVDVTLCDERLETVPLDDDADLVAITVETYTARRAYQIAQHYRSRGVPVVMGGYHPTFVPDEALRYADSVVLGDADEVWPRVVRDARRRALQRIYRGEPQPPLEGSTFDRRIFRGKRYPPIASVQYGRGCRYACDFCSIHAFYGSELRQRAIGEVAREIETLGRRAILLVDDNLFVNRSAAAELFRALTPLGVRWGCQVTIDVADDPKLLGLMARSGCIAALIGFESLESGSLDQMKKRWNLKGGSYAAAVRRFHDQGIMVYGSFVFGYDHDTAQTVDRTAEFAVESRLFLANFNILTPMPGAPLYERLRAQGRLLYEHWWLDPRYTYGAATFLPHLMSPDELTEACIRARSGFYRHRSIARRIVEHVNRRTPSRLALFLAANHISRRELATKLGRPLGSSELLLPIEPPSPGHLLQEHQPC